MSDAVKPAAERGGERSTTGDVEVLPAGGGNASSDTAGRAAPEEADIATPLPEDVDTTTLALEEAEVASPAPQDAEPTTPDHRHLDTAAPADRPQSGDEVSADGPRPAALSAGARLAAGVGLLLLAAASVTAALLFDEVPAARVAGTNLPVNQSAADALDPTAHNSPEVIVNPTDAANLAMPARVDSPRFSCALHVSFDAGATWSQTAIPVPEGEQPRCHQPDAAFGADGTLYLSYATLRGDGNLPHAVWVASSDDGGRTLGEPVKAVGKLAYQTRLTTDPAAPERLYLTWLQAREVGLFSFETVGNPIELALSEDGGATWEPRGPIDPEARERVVAPVPVASQGALYVAYLDLGEDSLDYAGEHQGAGGPAYDGTFELVVARSYDGGQSWDEAVVDEVAPIDRFLVFTPPAPSLAVHDSSVYVAFHDARRGDADVSLWASDDEGLTWSAAARVNDTRVGDRTSQYLPAISVAPNGRLDVVYYDRRADADNVMNEVSLQSSLDGGRTFTSRVRVSDRAFDSTIGYGASRSLPELGTRLGLYSTDKAALAAWADTRASVGSAKQDLVRAVIEFTDPFRLPPAARSALLYGGAALALAGLGLIAAWLLHRRPRLSS